MPSHLHPMTPDSLRPRPAPQAADASGPSRLSAPVPLPQIETLRPASFAPAIKEEETLFDLFLTEEDDDDDAEPDLVPTESMPFPACVPLYDPGFGDCKRGFRKKR